MDYNMLNHPKLKVHCRTGREGPHYDPYHYSEYCIETPEIVVVLHQGLANWLKYRFKNFERWKPGTQIGTGRIEGSHDGGDFIRNKALPAMTGWTITQIERMTRKLKSRCSRCGNRDFNQETGYPGETFEVCTKCGHINDSMFDRSAIE